MGSQEQSESIRNRVSVEQVPNLVKRLGVKPDDMAVISHYSAQGQLMRDKLCKDYPRVEVGSVNSFPGKEKEVVIISLVRSNKREKFASWPSHDDWTWPSREPRDSSASLETLKHPKGTSCWRIWWNTSRWTAKSQSQVAPSDLCPNRMSHQSSRCSDRREPCRLDEQTSLLTRKQHKVEESPTFQKSQDHCRPQKDSSAIEELLWS